MVRLYFLGVWHVSRLSFRFLMQFDWMQQYMLWTGNMLLASFKLWLWWIVIVLVAWLFWDTLLPIAGIAFMVYHVYQWRYGDTW